MKGEFNVMFSAPVKTAIGAAGLAVAAVFAATPAAAQTGKFGTMEELTAAGGSEVADYSVSNLKPSGNNDGVWVADVTVKAAKGTVTPVIGDFNAQAGDGSKYTAIEGRNPDGLTNQPIAPGSSRSGKLYFGVNGGTQPDSVVYSTGNNADQLVWKG